VNFEHQNLNSNGRHHQPTVFSVKPKTYYLYTYKYKIKKKKKKKTHFNRNLCPGLEETTRGGGLNKVMGL
jgi:hypothetical protein